MISVFELYQHPLKVVLGLLVVVLWELFWKGLALWHSAREGRKKWFVVILIVNSLGILPIIYLIWFRQKKEEIISENNAVVEETEEKEIKVEAKKKTPRKKKVNAIKEEDLEE